MVCRGDIPSNWEFFKEQWQDYEVATGLDQKNQQVRLAMFRSVPLWEKSAGRVLGILIFGPGKVTISSAGRRSSHGRNDTR